MKRRKRMVKNKRERRGEGRGGEERRIIMGGVQDSLFLKVFPDYSDEP